MSATYPDRFSCRPALLVCQHGFSLITAIFLLVILSVLGVFMVSLSAMQQTTSTQDMQGSRAYQAARAGIEWGAYQIMNPENTNPPAGQAQYVCPGVANLPALGSGLVGFAVRVGCISNDFTEGGNLVRIYQLTSTATFGAAPATSFIERSMTVSINTCRTAANGPSC